MDALILADGDASSRHALDAAWPGWDDAIGLVVAADGGARHAESLGVTIDVWVGDGDSTDPALLDALAARGIPLERSRPDKDESDTELAVLAALHRGAGGVVIVGALGGARIDHSLANIGLLALPALAGRPAALVDAGARISLIQAPDQNGGPVVRTLSGRAGDIVSLLPAGPGVVGVTTDGLAYRLRDEALPEGPARGLSNIRTAESASVTVRRGLLLIVESPARLPA
ncbi:MAG: thiamine diphosphokinase [Chloroflexi bacterium]|nr:thiamine diphosphokinase [Chloroflexota bacterium]